MSLDTNAIRERFSSDPNQWGKEDAQDAIQSLCDKVDQLHKALTEVLVASEKFHFAREQDFRNAYRLLKTACDAAEDELRASKSQGAV